MFGGEEVRAADEGWLPRPVYRFSWVCPILAIKRCLFRFSYSTRNGTVQTFHVYDMQVFGLSDWLADTPHQLTIGYDGWLVSLSQLERLKAIAPQLIRKPSRNLADERWDDRPAYPLQQAGD